MSRALADLLTSAGDVKDDALDGVDKALIDALEVDAATVNDKTVETSVPTPAVFTDTTYDKAAIDAMNIDAATVNGKSVAESVPSDAVFTDTDTNTTYPDLSQSDAEAGTATTPSVIKASILKAAIVELSPAGVQSDFDQIDNTAIDYIKNQPTLGTAAAKNAGSANGELILGSDVRLSDSRECDNSFTNPSTAKANIGLGNANNTSDSAKPVSTAQQTALDAKIAISSIVDDVTTTTTNVPLSANQGKLLQDAINNINTLLTSDETSLDTLQEIVDYIEANKSTLDALGISNISGLQTALNAKVATADVKNDLVSTDTDKPLSAAQGKVLEDGKVDKVTGKALSKNDLTDALKTQYDVGYSHSQATHAPSGAEVNVQANWNESGNSNDAYIQNKPTLGDAAAKDTGTAAGTVTAGDDSRLSDSRTCNNTFDNAATAKTALSLNDVENKSSATIRGEIVDSNIPASIARDSEVTTAISTHVGATDAHAISKITNLQMTLDGKQATLTHGISDTNTLKVNGSAADNEFARFTASGVEGRTSAEMRSDLNVADGANNYSHPNTAGNIHIPAGGSAGKFLKYNSDGVASWADDNDTIYTLLAASITALGGVKITATPTLETSSVTSAFVTMPQIDITNWSTAYAAGAEVKVTIDGHNPTVISDAGTLTLGNLPSNSYTAYVQVRELGKVWSASASTTVSGVSSTRYKYYQIGGLTYGTAGPYITDLKFYSELSQSGLVFPSRPMTQDITPKPYIITESGSYSAGGYEAWKMFGDSGGWWMLSRTEAQIETDWAKIDMGDTPPEIRSVQFTQYASTYVSETMTLKGSHTGEFSGEEHLLFSLTGLSGGTVNVN